MISPSEIATIVNYSNTKRTLVFLGAPRCGKSVMVKAGAKLRAKRKGKQFIEYAFRPDMLTKEKVIDMIKNPEKYFLYVDLRLSTKEPYDLEGRLEDDVVKVLDKELEFTIQKAPLWAKLLSIADGVLFLDELLDVQRPDVKSASYQLLLDNMAGNTKFRDDVLVVAASNTEEFSSLSQGFTLPQAGRCRIFKIRTPTVDEWINYMDNTGIKWDRSVAAYLSKYKNSLLKLPIESIPGGKTEEQIYKSETYETYPAPDTWTQLAFALIEEKELLKYVDLGDYIASFIGWSEAATFQAFFEYVITIDIDELLKDPKQIHEFDWNKQAAMISQIGSAISDNLSNLSKYKPLIDELVFGKDYNRAEFVAILKSCIKTDKLTEKDITEISKVLSSNQLFEIELLIKTGVIDRATAALYILTLLDERYSKVSSDISNIIGKFKK